MSVCKDCAGLSYCFRPWKKDCELKNEIATLDRILAKRTREENSELELALDKARRRVLEAYKK